MTKRASFLLFALWISALAYNPPVDTAGPLTVRLQEPAIGAYGAGGLADLSRPGVPVTLPVALENSSDAELRGSVRIQVIDRWRVTPAEPMAFTLRPRGRARLEFQLSFAEVTHNAHYPVHAFAEFDHQGRHYVAHPILILTPRQPNPPRASVTVPWQPVKAPDKGGVALWRMAARRESLTIEGEMLPGATGRETYDAGAVVQYGARVKRGETREAISADLGLRPPSMRERVAAVVVEYPLELPKTQPLKLRFATALGDSPGGRSVTFRVRVAPYDAAAGQAGEVVFERQTSATTWEDAEADLSKYAGSRVRVALESRAGAWSGSLPSHWAEPTVVAGTPAPRRAFPPASEAGSRVLGKVEGFEVRVWPGERGVLDSMVAFREGSRQLAFNGFRVRAAGDWLEDWRAVSELESVREEPSPGHYRVRHKFGTWMGSFDLVSDLWVERGVLRASFRMENAPRGKPWQAVRLEEVSAGPWSQSVERVYAGTGNVIEKPQAFRLGFDGHHMATSYVGFEFANGMALVQGVDAAADRLEVDPERRLYTMVTPHPQTLTFIPASNVWAGVKTWRAAGDFRAGAGVPQLAGRFVFDLWSGRYGESARELQRAFRYGLRDAAVIWHGWQRWGYDYRLPDIWPPNPQFGTLEEFEKLAAVCRASGVYFAPHDNYIDYYPDAEGFSYRNIVFYPSGQPYRAWFNYGRGAQAYRARADQIRPFLERNVKLIRDAGVATAYFIDVWSSAGPYDYWTEEGRFVERSYTRQVWGESFAWIRDFLGNNAPQISEAGHDQLIGWLDGSQANHLRVDDTKGRNFVWAITCGDAERIPWMDAAYHDIFVMHGAGYPGRYEGGLEARTHGIYSDDYVSTEVLTGHPAMAPSPFGRDVVRKYWLLQGIMRGLALRRIDGFRFDGANLHRQAVRWDNGGEVLVNRGAETWSAGGHSLPQYGFYARVPGKDGVAEAAIERMGPGVVEWARSAAMLYVNARGSGQPVSVGAVATDGGFRLDRDGDAVRLTPLPDSERFQARLRWNALPWRAPAPRYAEAVDENGVILRRAEVRTEGEDIVLACEPGVFAYRFR